MATVTMHTDDLNPEITENVETVVFYYAGQYREIDLGESNRKLFDRAMAKWINASRESSKTKLNANPNHSGTNGVAAEIREWARKNNIRVNERGRVDPEVVDAYNKAHAPTA